MLGAFLFDTNTSAAMPQRCCGLEDPCGGPARPCMFARCGDGGRAKLKKQRDGDRCAFCCPEAWARAWAARIGKGHITKRLAAWLQSSVRGYCCQKMNKPSCAAKDKLRGSLRRSAGHTESCLAYNIFAVGGLFHQLHL